jgi:predicted transcriptional regulator
MYEQKTPSYYVTEYGDSYDCTGHLNSEWPMYSFETPSFMLWNAIASEMNAKGWTDEEIKEWLQSKAARWACDGELGEAIIKLGKKFGKKAKKLEEYYK